MQWPAEPSYGRGEDTVLPSVFWHHRERLLGALGSFLSLLQTLPALETSILLPSLQHHLAEGMGTAGDKPEHLPCRPKGQTVSILA